LQSRYISVATQFSHYTHTHREREKECEKQPHTEDESLEHRELEQVTADRKENENNAAVHGIT